MAGKTLTATLQIQKTTDNTVVFQEVKDPSKPFGVRRFSGFYVNNREAEELGLSEETPRLEMTLRAVAA